MRFESTKHKYNRATNWPYAFHPTILSNRLVDKVDAEEMQDHTSEDIVRKCPVPSYNAESYIIKPVPLTSGLECISRYTRWLRCQLQSAHNIHIPFKRVDIAD